jgi:hypothetical protein
MECSSDIGKGAAVGLLVNPVGVGAGLLDVISTGASVDIRRIARKCILRKLIGDRPRLIHRKTWSVPY